jgi:RNA polymerase sigma-70 factor (ECF subfamily)
VGEAVLGHDLDARGLFGRYGDTVTRWVGQLGGPSVEIEDAVQDVFVVVHRRLREFRGDAQITTWLFRIALRVVRHHRRRHRWRRWIRGSAEDAAAGAPSPGPTPLEAYERREAIGRLYRALDRLSEKHRTALVLARFEGLPADEIARLMGVEPVTVRVWLHRATAEFRRLLEPVEGGRLKTTSGRRHDHSEG